MADEEKKLTKNDFIEKYLKLAQDSHDYKNLAGEKTDKLIDTWHKYHSDEADEGINHLIGQHRVELSDKVMEILGEKKNFSHLEGQEKRKKIEEFVNNIGKFALEKYYMSKTLDKEKAKEIVENIMKDDELFHGMCDKIAFGEVEGREGLIKIIEQKYSTKESNLRDFLHGDTEAWNEIYGKIAHSINPLTRKRQYISQELNQIYRREDVKKHAIGITGLEYKGHISGLNMLNEANAHKKKGELPHDYIYTNREIYENLPEKYKKSLADYVKDQKENKS